MDQHERIILKYKIKYSANKVICGYFEEFADIYIWIVLVWLEGKINVFSLILE